MSYAVPKESGPSCIFSVMSYMVLSSSYVAPEMYPYYSKEYLDWETRGQSIIDEINYYEYNVICLQEVELEVFLQFYSPTLKAKGYDGVFAPKSRAKTISDAKRRLVHVCAIFWKTRKFTLISQQLIEFNQSADHEKKNQSFFYNLTFTLLAYLGLVEQGALNALNACRALV
ncbi:CCR4-NOT transcription complex subunit 6-like [Microplitis mediator]|uniref:CCR4-NOT transcription complex subunit 6-like n=1 Tax=Microplitis mediator TaxID=375433 RepID=UPI002556A907|nr:CCR4-NOT transcription complex subunit 6-like [Microplitis mediator]